MKKTSYLFLITFISLCTIVFSCKKGVLVEDYQQFVRLTINGLEAGIDVYCDGKKIKLPHVPVGQVNLSLVQSSTGNSIFESEYNFTNNQTLYFFQEQLLSNPQDTMEAVDGTVQIRLANFSQKISPNGDPIHLVFQQSLGIDWELFVNLFAEHTDTVRNVSTVFGNTYNLLKKEESPLTSNVYEARAKVLKEDESPLLIDGKEVYIWFSGQSGSHSIFTSYTPNDDELILYPGDDLTAPSTAWISTTIPNLFMN